MWVRMPWSSIPRTWRFPRSHCLSGKGPAAYDEITRVPLFIRGPGIASGSVSDAPVSHINLAPAVFELFGIPQPSVFAGKSLCRRHAESRSA